MCPTSGTNEALSKRSAVKLGGEDWFGHHQARLGTEGQLRRSLDGTADLSDVRACGFNMCVCVCVSERERVCLRLGED